ncbi:hypothetical protein Q3E60_12720 [Enterococcus faecium]|nr:hypothetical protein [Enterococcus faecium]
MINTYIKFWSHYFNIKGKSTLNDVIVSLIGNFALYLLVYAIVGLFIPVTWENGFLVFLNIFKIILIIPTITLFIRFYNLKSNKK